MIDIITDSDGGDVLKDGLVMVTQYIYHPGDTSLKKVKFFIKRLEKFSI